MATLLARETAAGFARVAVERGVDQYPDGLTYAVPRELEGLKPGQRVLVPLGKANTPTHGYIIELADSPAVDLEKVKAIIRGDESGARLPGEVLTLARWVSSYYCTPIGMTLAAMMPGAVKRNIGAVAKTFVDLGDPLPLEEKLPPKQRHVLEVLAKLPAEKRPIELRALAELAELRTVLPIKRLINRGLLDVSHRTEIEADWAEHAVDRRVPELLTPEQQPIIDTIGRTLTRGFSTHLIFGVTGSGKTEVYIRLIEKVLAAGRTSLMLVPEIALTPQTGGRLIGRFARHRVAILHSGLTAAQRHQQWMLVANGTARVILGARSAVFAPVPDGELGLIVVDEEHDGSYKQDQAPRYHGRDVAIRRAQIANCPVVLGSATPSLESWHNATARKTSTLHQLRKRAPGLRLPKVHVVDFREEMRQRKDRHIHLLGPMLEAAIGRMLDQGGQILLLLNRRGYANYIACPSQVCGWVMTCDHCDVTVVYHLNRKLPTGGYVRCHHCLSEQKLPETCPQCGKKVVPFGLGTQRVEEELARKFPQLIEDKTMLRMDSDNMQNARRYYDALKRFGDGEIRLLIGTQMIAKGLDYPGVRLVGVINADTTINLPDFRASERTFQLVNQVAGRCGRGKDPGLTIVQTFNPSAPAIQLAATHDYESFARQELIERERCALPPVTRMARIVIRHKDHVKCIASARRLAKDLTAIAAQFPSSHRAIQIRGPAPCPIARIADKHRQQIEILASSAVVLQQFLSEARGAGLLRAAADMVIDVDPIAML